LPLIPDNYTRIPNESEAINGDAATCYFAGWLPAYAKRILRHDAISPLLDREIPGMMEGPPVLRTKEHLTT